MASSANLKISAPVSIVGSITISPLTLTLGSLITDVHPQLES